MLDSIQHVQVFLKYPRLLQAGFACHRKNPSRHPHAHTNITLARCTRYPHEGIKLPLSYTIVFIVAYFTHVA